MTPIVPIRHPDRPVLNDDAAAQSDVDAAVAAIEALRPILTIASEALTATASVSRIVKDYAPIAHASDDGLKQSAIDEADNCAAEAHSNHDNASQAYARYCAVVSRAQQRYEHSANDIRLAGLYARDAAIAAAHATDSCRRVVRVMDKLFNHCRAV